MKLFNIHSGSRGLPRFIKGMDWATGLFLRTPSRRGARELVKKPHPLAVNRNRRLNNVALLVPLRSAQFSSVSFLFANTLLGVTSFFDHIFKVQFREGCQTTHVQFSTSARNQKPLCSLHSTWHGMVHVCFPFLRDADSQT